jgi:hypothetical protein
VAPPLATPLSARSPFPKAANAAGPLTIWQRIGRALAFWRPDADPVECTLLVPAGVLPGEVVNVQVICHHARLDGEARGLQGWCGTERLSVDVEYGSETGLHVAVTGLSVDQDLRSIVWRGRSEAVSFTIRVPRDWPPGLPAKGVLTVGLDQAPVARLAFQLPVVAAQVPAV